MTQAYQSLITSKGAPSPLLRELFQALNLSSENIIEMNTIAQNEFLRKPGEERWNMKEVPHEKEKMLPILEKLGVIHEVLPSSQMYESVDYIFIHGARVSRMQDRVKFFLTKVWPELSEQTKKRVKVVFLSGDRKLDAALHEKEDLFNPDSSKVHLRADWKKPSTLIETENDAARIIWDQMVSDKFLRDKILFVPALQTQEGKRPTTKDTIKQWLNSFHTFHKNPNSLSPEYRSFWKDAPDLYKSRILAISNNPFIPYQDQVFKNTLAKEGFEHASLETVGPEADPETLIAVHLDNIARWLYELVGRLKEEK